MKKTNTNFFNFFQQIFLNKTHFLYTKIGKKIIPISLPQFISHSLNVYFNILYNTKQMFH